MTEVCNRTPLSGGCIIFNSKTAQAEWQAKNQCGKPAVGAMDIGISGQMTRLVWCADHTPPGAESA